MKTRTSRWCRRTLLTALLVAATTTGAAWAQSRTYTLDADFDEGSLLNVNHTVVSDQLQLNQVTTPFPFVNIACSARGTIVRIDVDTGAILGEYLTAPNGMGRDPSRTTVDQFGNVWVSNRAEGGFSGGQPKGSITRIGLVIGGTRVDADGTPNPLGQYLAPPFEYSTCIDRDGDGFIKTSRGLGNILPWTNAGGADTHGGVTTADDECIINYTRVAGTNARTVAIDANNDVWTGGLGDLDHEKVSGVTGLPVAGTQFNLGCGGYGGLVDGNNVLWSARGGANLLRYDATTNSGACLNASHGDYGIGIDPTTGEIWHTNLFGNRVAKLAPNGALIAAYPHGNDAAQGVVVDGVGNVWVAHSLFGATTVGHLRTDGTYVGNVALPGGNGPTGVAVDANGKVWVANINSNNAMRIDPAAGPIGGGGFPVGAVDLTVNLGAGASPYNYSDMTGFVAIGSTAPQGTWTVVFDGGQVGTDWGTVTWTSAEPLGSSVAVEVRAAATQVDLAGETFVAVSNGVDFRGTGVVGQFIEIRVTIARGPDPDANPVLFDLSVEANQDPDCSGAVASVAEIWPPNHAMVPVSVLGVTDPDGNPVTITVTGITQDEPLEDLGDGNFEPDGAGVGTGTASVRAERQGGRRAPGNGRVYVISFVASDGLGGECSGSVTVCVPHDQGMGSACVDDGQDYDSTGGGARTGGVPLPGGTLDVIARPNPFNPTTTLEFGLREPASVRIVIYNALGRRVRLLTDGGRGPGQHSVLWDGRDDQGGVVPSGVYLYRVQAGPQETQGRLLLLK